MNQPEQALMNIPLPPPMPPPSLITTTSSSGLRKEAHKDRLELPGSSGLTFKSEADKPQTTHVRTLTSDLAELETLVAEPPPQPQPKRPSSSISTSKTSDKRKQPRLLTHQVQEEVDKEQQRLQYEKYLHEKHEQVKKIRCTTVITYTREKV